MSSWKPFLAACAILLAACPTTARADGIDLSLHVGGAIGDAHEIAQAGNVATAATQGPTASGDAHVLDARGTLGAAIEAQLFDMGAGLPRLFLTGGATVFLGNRLDGAFTNLHGGAGYDTGLTLSRLLSVDLGVGGVFPLCRTPACVELKAAIGIDLAPRKITSWTSDPSVGSARLEASDSKLDLFPFLAVYADVPLCSECSARSTRLRLGVVVRSESSALALSYTPTGNFYQIGTDGYLQVEPQVGLVLPL